MRKLWIIALVLGITILLFNQWRLNRRLESLTAARGSDSETPAPASDDLAQRLRNAQSDLDQTRLDLAAANRRIGELNSKVRELEQKLENSSTNAPAPFTSSPLVTDASTAPFKGRRWGPEQATGAPDTAGAGDYPTAWAPLLPNGGLEWLKLDYQNFVNVAEIRVRESYNPGAVYKVTAVDDNGGEYTLWEGTENAGPAPYDSIFHPSASVYTRSIKIYLDTSRVSSWSEVDAVELVGRDGSRQWAVGASASSTYASQLAVADPGLEDLGR